jgi:hypothetical protein
MLLIDVAPAVLLLLDFAGSSPQILTKCFGYVFYFIVLPAKQAMP